MNATVCIKDLPLNWSICSLVDISEGDNAIVDGPFGSNLKVSDYIEDSKNGVPVLSTKNLEGDYSDSKVRFVSKQKFEELKRSQVRPGDILVAKIGSIGKTGVYPKNAKTALIPANLLKFTVSKKVAFKYIFAYMNYFDFQNKIKAIATATAQPAFNVTKFRSLGIPIPPLPEQRRIVAKIEELFSDLDKGIENLKTAQQQLKTYRQSVLKWAFEGKLTNVHVKDGELPEGWTWEKLGKLCETTSGGTPSRKNPEYYNGNIPWVKSGELSKGLIYKTEEYITKEAVSKSNAKIFPVGTLLIALYGATIGKLAFLGVDAATNQAVCGIFKSPLVENKYLFNYLAYKKHHLMGQAIGGAQPNISQGILRGLEIALPPNISEQSRIVLEIEKRLSVCDKMEESITQSLAQSEALRQSILKKAFEGKLVPQDSNDEPASVLLDRIRSERAKNDPVKKIRGKKEKS